LLYGCASDFYSAFEEIKNSVTEYEVPSTSSRNGVSFKVKLIRKLREDNEA
jgi:hypothetical protein